MNDRPTSRAPAVTRAILILRYLGSSRSPVGVNAIARDLELIPSTCLHILRALEHEGFVQSNEADLRYSLSSGLVRFARQTLRTMPEAGEAGQWLPSISDKYKTSVALLQVGPHAHSTVLAAAHPATSYSLVLETGRRLPVYAGASGRCVAASRGLIIETARSAFTALPWARPLSFEEWQRDVAACLVRGYAIDDGHHLLGYTSIAVPLPQRVELRNTLVSVSADGQLSVSQQSELVSELIELSGRLAMAIAHTD